MAGRKELEIKLELAPKGLARLDRVPFIRSLKKAPKHQTEVTVYFDTDKRKLRGNGLMLRVRRTGGRYIQTIKATGNAGVFARDEWETDIADEAPDLSQVTGTALEPLMKDKVRRRLKPVFATRVQRTVYPLADDARVIELAIDRGKIDTGDDSAPLCELELELKRGNDAELFEVARELTDALAAQIVLKSKSERGYELMDGRLDTPAKAAPVDLAACLSTRDGFQTIGRACLKQVIDNKAALLKGDPEGVHQMRVGLRRLRAAMSLFSELLGDRQTDAIKTELKWLAGELAPAREFEVLMHRAVAPLKAKPSKRGTGIPRLSRELKEKRKAALERAQDAVASARFRALTLEVAAWLESGAWSKPSDDLVRSRGEMPIEVFAAEQLRRRWRKVRKRGKGLARLDAGKRHRLRIQVKKLRYAAEFFGNLFAGKKAAKQQKKFAPALERLQDGLGDLNDIVVDENLITAMGIPPGRPSRQQAFAAGLLTGREDARFDAAMAGATDGYQALVKVKPFW